MSKDSNMYEMQYPAPVVGNDPSDGLVLIIALQGFADAGLAVEGASKHLKAALDSHPVVSFYNDELIDYRSRRPAVTMNRRHITEIENLELDIRAMRDLNGRSFLLLSGPEPDLRWQAFTEAVGDLVEKYNVKDTIALYGAPMTVPHTRPLVVSAHGNSPELVGNLYSFESRLTMPGSASLFIERELHHRDRNVAGFTAHVPNYIAGSSYPQATYQLLQSVQEATGLSLPLRSIERDIDRANRQLQEHIAENHEIMQVVSAMEEQYDQEMERYRRDHPSMMLPGEKSLPSGDELGEEFEQFLASIENAQDPRSITEQDLSDFGFSAPDSYPSEQAETDNGSDNNSNDVEDEDE